MSDDRGTTSNEPVAEAMVPVVAEKVRQVRSTNILFNLVVLIVIAIMGGLNACEARRAATRVDIATECIIEQFSEHRAADRAAHQAFSKKLDAPYEVEPGQLPPHIVDRLEEACGPFIKGDSP